MPMMGDGGWPEEYEAPVVEALGTVWDRTGAVAGSQNDAALMAPSLATI